MIRTAQINGERVELRPQETILQAALRHGLDFPNSCRVGGCGTCKCRLTAGAVRELTETAYLLTADELEARTILACQSVPLTDDVAVQVGLTGRTPPRAVKGRVIGQHLVTHDITRVSVQLEQPLGYRAGQFAQVSFDDLPGQPRSYSFATPPRADGLVEFFVRRVEGGQISTFVHEQRLEGRAVQVEGPFGEFWLRPADAPVVMIAGGSGLPPMLAMLRQAAAEGCTRPVTVLFGAREERDLYALEDLEVLSREWKGRFRFVPVLSASPPQSSWAGARGLVTEQLKAHLEPGAQAYLCGPVAMVDAACAVLREHGVPRERIWADRFTTRADAPDPQAELALPPTLTANPGVAISVLHYLKFFSFHLVGLFAVATLLAGGPFISLGLLLVVGFYVVGDALGGDDLSTPDFRHPGVLTAQLWGALPLLMVVVFTAVWTMSPGDPLGFGAWVTHWSGVDVLGARAATSLGHHVSAWVLTGLMIGMVGTIPAHELTHRTWDPVSMFVGRCLLAFSFDTSFAIEHVYGHHRYVSTIDDPATAPRGRSVYWHLIASTVRGNVSAWRIEAARLSKKRLGRWSWRNAFLRGQVLSVLLLAAAFAMGGLEAMAFFTACALWGKALLEIVNYMEHYGLVRNPATPVQPRHSWNTNRRLSSWSLFNLTRHSHHHAQGEVPYQALRPYPDAPMMLGGYLTTIIIALVPPLWSALMRPRVQAWDRDFASDEERLLAAQADARR